MDAAREDAGAAASGADAGVDAQAAPGDSALGDSATKADLTCNQATCGEQKCATPASNVGKCLRLDCGGEVLCEGAGDRCVLEALRDGRQGRLTWTTTTSYLHKFTITATIGSGRVGSGYWSESYDSPSGFAAFTQLPLKPPAFFEACLAAVVPDAGTSDEVQDCLRHAFDVCP